LEGNRGVEKTTYEELHELYFSPNIRMIRARIIKWAGHVKRRRARRNGYRIFIWGNLKQRDQLEDQVEDGSVILL
jgi:hypothetical protein